MLPLSLFVFLDVCLFSVFPYFLIHENKLFEVWRKMS